MFPQRNSISNSLFRNAPPANIQTRLADQGPISFSLQFLSNERRMASGLGDQDRILIFRHLRGVYPSHRIFGFSIETKPDESPFSASRQMSGTIFSTGAGDLDDQLRTCKNRFLYQIARHAWSVLQQDFSISPDRLKRNLEKAIRNAHSICIVCGQDLATGDLLYRSTTCGPSCSVALRRSPLEVRVPEIDIHSLSPSFIVLHAMAMVAIVSGHAEDMSPCPLTPEMVTHVANVIESETSFLELERIWSKAEMRALFLRWIQTFKNDHLVERALAWSCTHYRGCLVVHKALNMGPGVELLLFNGNCDIEWAFARHLETAGGNSSIVFHGTTGDRMYPILCNGLQYDARHQQTGRAMGHGIYATDDSVAALHYARDYLRPRWMPANFKIPVPRHILLVCELVRPKSHLRALQDMVSGRSCDIYVVGDPSQIIVRAVILTQVASPWPEIDVESLSNVIQNSRRHTMGSFFE